MEFNPYQIRPADDRDLAFIVELERECGLNSGGVNRFRMLMADSNTILLVAHDPDESDTSNLIGLFSGAVVVDELQIDNIAVRAEFRRLGVGSALLKNAMSAAAALGAVSAVLEVRASNLAARKLYENHGFSLLNVRRAYYCEPPEDALTLGCRMAKETERAAENEA
jgi:ribosomal-protein-alanine acetyltransferase